MFGYWICVGVCGGKNKNKKTEREREKRNEVDVNYYFFFLSIFPFIYFFFFFCRGICVVTFHALLGLRLIYGKIKDGDVCDANLQDTCQ